MKELRYISGFQMKPYADGACLFLERLPRRSFLKHIGVGSIAVLAGTQMASGAVEASTTGSFVNINDYNGDIQSAINAVQEAGGGEVYLPAGRYEISNTLTISGHNVTLRGAGKAATVLHASGPDSTKSMILIKHNTDRVYNAKISDLTLSAKSNQAGADGEFVPWFQHGIVLDSSHNFQLNNVRIEYFINDGLRFENKTKNSAGNLHGGPDQVVLLNCQMNRCGNGMNTNDTGHSTHIYGGTFDWNRSHGILTGGRNSVFIKDADVEHNRDVGLKITSGANITIRDCTFEENATTYILTGQTQCVHIWIGSNAVAKSIVIDGCFFYAKSMRALLRLDKGEGVTLTNNYVHKADQFLLGSAGQKVGCFVLTAHSVVNGTPMLKDIYYEDFLTDTITNAASPIDNTRYVVSNLKPTAVSALPEANASIRGFIVRLTVPGKPDELHMCVQVAADLYKWAKINLTIPTN
ncbi:hypothetical protein KNP414_07126 [Paenibacillus mucilaginosus KNP414]|uniref:Right handed beta helix domain-containing protein n=1 Tax=Paenibacillus mucilaginosus (strain KNP414) TaxID=1036673 RepID=F8FM10_PAEMK|nr:hypothetical protein KNP414_07126 [Paenibacillus mucilaginosus KNP414]